MNIVSTSVSSFEGDLPRKTNIVSKADTETNMPGDSMDEADITIEIEQQSRFLRQLDQEVKDLIEDFHEDDVEIARIHTIERDLDRIQIARDKFRSEVRKFLECFEESLDHATVTTWKNAITATNTSVKEHARKIRSKAHEVAPQRQMSEFEREQIRIQMEQLSLLKANASNESAKEAKVKENERSKVLCLATKKYDSLIEECGDLNEVVIKNPVDFLSDEKKYPDQKISRLVREISDWKLALKSICKNYNVLQEQTVVYKLSEQQQEALDKQIEDTKNAVNKLIEVVEQEDQERNLRTLDTSRAEQRKFKTFSGALGEDFLYFKKDFEETVIANRISRSNQLEKLRECLIGEAMKQVPKNMTGGIAAAWQALKVMFGDPSKLLRFRLKALEELGQFPPSLKGNQPNYAAQAAWLAPLLVEINEIISLGENHPELHNSVFNSTIFDSIITKFTEPHDMQMLDIITGGDKDKLKAIKTKLESVKARVIRYSAKVVSEQATAKAASTPKKGSIGHGEIRGMTIFRNPQRFSECRICDLYVGIANPPAPLHENHLSDWVTGCPIFIAMKTTIRQSKARQAEFCLRCFDKKVQYTKGGSHVDKESNQPVPCTVTKETKHRYSCLEVTCLNHMWVCRQHQIMNKATMVKQQEKLKKSNLNLNFPISLVKRASNISNDVAPTYVPTQLPIGSATVSSKPPSKRNKKSKPESDKTNFIPVPKGSPMFMFQGVEGKTRSVNWFYDSGCSNLIMKNEIPVEEYDSTLLQKGPFCIGGIGEAKVIANAEYLISVQRKDGRKQHFQGVTMDRITSDFPIVNLETAVADVKKSDQDNQILQACSVPPQVGGSVDVLVGIMYLSSFPELVHMLDCGLSIFKVKLSSHNQKWNALIGGPHETFSFLSEKVGNTAQLLASFADSLKVFRTCGPPSLSSLPWTVEEELSVKSKSAADTEVEEIKHVVMMEFAENEITNFVADKYVNNDKEFEKKEEKVLLSKCMECSSIETEESSAFLSEESAWELKGLLREVENSGLDVEYRCVRCRNCADCRNSDQTDKISLREEQELQQCRDSVDLDLVNKRINVSLPLRASEREFLVSNKEIAEQILEQQCKKYFSDEETKSVLLKAFDKLFTPSHLLLLDDLEVKVKQQFLEKEVQYFIPWRIQFKDSVSTPARPVFDGSTRTKKRSDGSGGRCLNDLVCKGVIKSINMIKLLLRFSVGRFAITADIRQFYNSGKLTPTQWNLQRFLFKENLDPNNETKEGVICTLIYGVKSSSCQTECIKEKLSDLVREEKPDVSKVLEDSTYVDDIGESKANTEEVNKLIEDTDEVLASVGVTVKGWTHSGTDPNDKVSTDGVSLDIGGMKWFPKLDLMEVKIPVLHFGKVIRGRLKQGTKLFEGGTMADLDRFLPSRLSKRQVASKAASIFDPLGKLAPVMALIKRLLRLTNARTVGWDDPMPASVRSKWCEAFWRLESLRGLKFTRPVMPNDAIDTKLRIMVGADAAEQMEIIGAWGGFKKSDGSWSCQHLLGRSLLASENSTIPKLELDSLCAASNMKWIIRRALDDWVDSELLFGDSRIAMFWTTSENRRLGIFHRARVLQIRRGSSLDEIYHVRSAHNACDAGTRPDKLSYDAVGPESKWERGAQWMARDIDDAIAADIITPALQLRIKPEEENEFNDGCVFEKPEILTRGHVTTQARIEKIEQRALFSDYPLLPTKFKFVTVVRIYSNMIRFAKNCLKSRRILKHLLAEAGFQLSFFLILSAQAEPADKIPSEPDEAYLAHTEECNSMALTYLYQQGSREVKEFNSKSVIRKQTVEKDGILYSQGRLIDGMTFLEAGGLNIEDLGPLGINIKVPVLDRFSPLSYSIADHVHWVLGKHRGVETCNRISLEKVHILQGATLYKELGEQCIRCKMKRKHFMEVSMGPVSQHQLSVAPPMWAAQCDLFGPCTVYVPGYERETRGRKALATEVHVVVFVCPSTRLVNLQVIEGKDAGFILEAVTRLACEMGVPKFLMVDDDSTVHKALRELEVDIRDLQFKLHTEKGITFDICPVQGHNKHGQVERTIRSIQESLNDCGIKKLRLHATSLQTLLKLVENTYNNAPLGYRHGRDADNGPVLKTISPNMMRMGHNNERALDGNMRLPVGGYEMVEKVEKMYQAWYKLWRDSVVPKLILKPKWFKTDHHLQPGDLVYYEKDSGKATSPWVMGMVQQVERGRDGLIREATIVYRNHGETFNRVTNRAVRSLVKIFSIDEGCIQEDLAEVQRRIDRLQAAPPPVGQERRPVPDVRPAVFQVVVQEDGDGDEPILRPADGGVIRTGNLSKPVITVCKKCCCLEHCKMNTHHTKTWDMANLLTNSSKFNTFLIPKDFPYYDGYYDVYRSQTDNGDNINKTEGSRDTLTELMMNVNINIDSLY